MYCSYGLGKGVHVHGQRTLQFCQEGGGHYFKCLVNVKRAAVYVDINSVHLTVNSQSNIPIAIETSGPEDITFFKELDQWNKFESGDPVLYILQYKELLW